MLGAVAALVGSVVTEADAGLGRQLGHATASITLDTYGHLFPDVPMFMVEELLEQGELEVVLPAFAHAWPDLHIFMPPHRAGIARVRALVTFLYQKLDGEV